MTKRSRAFAVALISLAVLALAAIQVFASGTWSFQHGNVDGSLHGIWFTDVNTGIAVGEGTSSSGVIFRTTNGGATWTQVTNIFAAGGTTPLAIGDVLNRVFFSDKLHGLAVGERGDSSGADSPVLRTSDGGLNWYEASFESTPNELEAVFMQPGNLVAYAAGPNRTLVKSIDGGANWLDAGGVFPTINNSTTYSLDAMWWVSPTEGWLGGNRVGGMTHGLILHTTDGGANWTEDTAAVNTGGYESMMFTDATHGWAVGDCQAPPVAAAVAAVTQCRGVIAHWNGTTWSDISPAAADGFDMQGVWFVDSTHGWAVGDSTDELPGQAARTILFTSDGGVTWTVQPDAGPHPAPTPSVTPSVSPSPDPISATSGLAFVFATDLCHAWTSGGEGLILGLTDACPTSSPTATQAPAVVLLPKAGHPGTPVGPAWALLGILLVSAVPMAVLLVNRRSRQG